MLGQEDERVELPVGKPGRVLVVEAPALAGRGGRHELRRDDPAPLSILGGKAQVKLYLDGVRSPFSLERLCADKGASIPSHTHDSDELLYVVSGAATTTVGARSLSQRPGETLTIPRGTPHAVQVERDLILGTLYHCLGNRTHAANILGISIRTLRNKLKQYTAEGVAVPSPGEAERAAL